MKWTQAWLESAMKKIYSPYSISRAVAVAIVPLWILATTPQSYSQAIPDAARITKVEGRTNARSESLRIRRGTERTMPVVAGQTQLEKYRDALIVPPGDRFATLSFMFANPANTWRYAGLIAQTLPQPTLAEYKLPCRSRGGTVIFGWRRASDSDRGCEYGVRVASSRGVRSQLPSLSFPISVKSLDLAQTSPESVLYCGARSRYGSLVTESEVLDDSCQEVVQKCATVSFGSDCFLVSMGEWNINEPDLNLSLACSQGPFNRRTNGSLITTLLSELTQQASSNNLTGCAVNIYSPEEEIIIPGSEQTLIRTIDSGTGVIVDVLLGSVIIRSINGLLGVPVRAGQRYSVPNNTTTPIDARQVARSPNVQNFLDPKQTISPNLPAQVAEDMAAQIADHRVALGLPPIAPLSSYYLRVTSGYGSITNSNTPAVTVGTRVNQVTGGYNPSTRELTLDIAGRQVGIYLDAPLNDNVAIKFKVIGVRPRIRQEPTVSQFSKLVQNILKILEVEGTGTLRKQGNQIRGNFTVRGNSLAGKFIIQGNDSDFEESSPSREGTGLASGQFVLNVQFSTSANLPIQRFYRSSSSFN